MPAILLVVPQLARVLLRLLLVAVFQILFHLGPVLLVFLRILAHLASIPTQLAPVLPDVLTVRRPGDRLRREGR